MRVAEEIRARLALAFDPAGLEVIDESESHAGHAGYRDGGQSHFRVVISSPVFRPLDRVARHRAVHEAIGADLMARIHALQLDVSG